MWSTAPTVSAGDTIIVWLTRDLLHPVVVTPGKDFNSKYGNYRHQDFVGLPYGSKLAPRSGRGFIHVLRPTPELWTLALPHRTQILYLADIAYITSALDITPGSRVIEAGTGSGSFSHSIARTIGSTGHLWSYEFHEARAAKAKEEFTRHGMNDIVSLEHRNVCKDGFTVTDVADSVFLDLPAPWEAVPHAKKALRKDRITRICCFSPCMEQVLRTVSALNEAGFTEITMHETLLRPHDVSAVSTPPSVRIAAARLKESEIRRDEKRKRQLAKNKVEREEKEREKEKASLIGAQTGTVAEHLDADENMEDLDESMLVDDEPTSFSTSGERRGEKRHYKDQMEEGIQPGEGGTKRLKMDGKAVAEPDVSASLPSSVIQDPPSSTSTLTAAGSSNTSLLPLDSTSSPSRVISTPAPLTSSTTAASTSTIVSKQDVQPSTPTPSAPTLQKISVSKAFSEVRGHTSFLTFACLIPLPPTTSNIEVKEVDL